MANIFYIYIIGIPLCLLLNLTVIIVYCSKRRKIRLEEIQLVSLAVSDALQAATGYTIELYVYRSGNNINGALCCAAGFCNTFLALVSITHIVALSIERYITLCYPYLAHSWFTKKCVSCVFILPAWLYGFLWAILPVIGWSSYHRENGEYFRCSIDLQTRDSHHQSYTYSLLVFCFIIPVILLVTCQVRIRIEINKMNRRTHTLGNRSSQIYLAQSKIEKQHTFMVIVMIVAYLAAWTPYAVCVLWLTISRNLPIALTRYSAMFAKSSALYNPVIYAFMLKEFRTCFKKLIGIPTNEVSSLEQAAQ